VERAGDHAPGGLRLDAIDGLRAVAAGSVLVYHVWRFAAPDGRTEELGALSTHVLPHLWHGVTLFFVLSGFLLYRPFAAAALRGTRAPSVTAFLRNRALRILPAYWVVLLVAAFVLRTALVPQGETARTEGVPDAELLVVDLLLLQNFSFDALFTGIGPAWSLAVEAVFYAVLPLVAVVALAGRARGLGPRAAALAPVAALLVVGLTGKVAAHGGLVGWELGVLRSFWAWADLFALGMLVAVVAVAVQDGRLRLARGWRPAAGAAVVAVAAVGVLTQTSNLRPLEVATSAHNLAVGVACALVVALVVLPGAPRLGLRRALEARAVVAAGIVSYSVFLWHEPLLRWLRLQGATADGGAGFALNLALVALLTGVLSVVTYRLVEEPALRLRARTPGGARAADRPPAGAAPGSARAADLPPAGAGERAAPGPVAAQEPARAA